MTSETPATVEVTLSEPTVSNDGTVVYPKSVAGGGKCFYPVTTGKPKCAWHKLSDAKAKLPSRCTHPNIGRNLTVAEINAMSDCQYYEPREDYVNLVKTQIPAQAGVPTGTYADSLRNAHSNKETVSSSVSIEEILAARKAKADPEAKKAISDAFKSALIRNDDIRIGREILSVMPPHVKVTIDESTGEEKEEPDEYLNMLVPRLPFTYMDNIDKVQGSALEFVARAVKENDIAVFIGHLGVGKTTAIQRVAEMCNQPLVIVNCDGQLTVEQIIGTRIPDKDQATGLNILRWQDAPLLWAYRTGHWVCIDDYTFTGSDVFSAIYGLMTNSYYQVQTTGEIIPRHPKFRMFLTTNPPEFMELYPNRQQPDAAFLSRIGARYWMNFLPEDAERKAMQEAAPTCPADALDRMQRVISVSRKMLEQNSINFVFSTRHAVNWAKKVARHGDLKKAAFEAFIADMDIESRDVMLNKILDSQSNTF